MDGDAQKNSKNRRDVVKWIDEPSPPSLLTPIQSPTLRIPHPSQMVARYDRRSPTLSCEIQPRRMTSALDLGNLAHAHKDAINNLAKI